MSEIQRPPIDQLYTELKAEQQPYREMVDEALSRLEQSPIDEVRSGAQFTENLLEYGLLDIGIWKVPIPTTTVTNISFVPKNKLGIPELDNPSAALYERGARATHTVLPDGESYSQMIYTSRTVPRRNFLTLNSYGLTTSSLKQTFKPNALDLIETDLSFTVVELERFLKYRFDTNHPYLQSMADATATIANVQRSHLSAIEQQGRALHFYGKDPRAMSDEEIIKERVDPVELEVDCSFADLQAAASDFFVTNPYIVAARLGKLQDLLVSEPRESTLFEFFYTKIFEVEARHAGLRGHLRTSLRDKILRKHFMQTNNQSGLEALSQNKHLFLTGELWEVVNTGVKEEMLTMPKVDKAKLAAEYILKSKLLDLDDPQYF